MHRRAPRTVPFVMPYVFGGPPQTPHDFEPKDPAAA